MQLCSAIFARQFHWQMREERDGEAANPGPTSPHQEQVDRDLAKLEQDWSYLNDKGLVIVESINATSFATNLEQMKERQAHITAFQEHAMTDDQIQSVMHALHSEGWNMQAGPKDPEFARKTG